MRLKGSSNAAGTSTTARTSRSIEFKIRTVQLKRNESKTVKEAFALACTEFSLPLTGSMTKHPNSIFSTYQSDINKKLEEKDDAGNLTVEATRVIGLVQAAGLDTEDEPETSTDADVADESEIEHDGRLADDEDFDDDEGDDSDD